MSIKTFLTTSILALCSTLLFATEVAGQIFWETSPQYYHHIGFLINANTPMDSVVSALDTTYEQWLKNDFGCEPTTLLEFVQMNEMQVDSAVIRLGRGHKSRVEAVRFINCPIKELPYSIRSFRQLNSLYFRQCDSISSLNEFNSYATVFRLSFEGCRIKTLPEGTENLGSMLKLMLYFPNDFDGFDTDKELRKFHRRNNVVGLFLKYKLQRVFPESVCDLTSLQNLVVLMQDSISTTGIAKLVNLNTLNMTDVDANTYKLIGKIERSWSYPGFQYHFTSAGSNFFTEDVIETEQLYRIKSKEHSVIYKRRNFIDAEFSFWYNFHKNQRKFTKYTFEKKEFTLTQDTVKGEIKVHFKDIEIQDSLTMSLAIQATDAAEYPTDKVVKTMDYFKGEDTIDMNTMRFGKFFLLITIHGRKTKMEIWRSDDWKK